MRLTVTDNDGLASSPVTATVTMSPPLQQKVVQWTSFVNTTAAGGNVGLMAGGH